MTPIERAARAMQAEARRFSDPAYLYIEPEALYRWEEAHPDQDADDETEESGEAWNLKSYAILVRAVLEAIREPSEGMKVAGGCADTDGLYGLGASGAEECWKLMLDAALPVCPHGTLPEPAKLSYTDSSMRGGGRS